MQSIAREVISLSSSRGSAGTGMTDVHASAGMMVQLQIIFYILIVLKKDTNSLT
jgi:hypothetical protein